MHMHIHLGLHVAGSSTEAPPPPHPKLFLSSSETVSLQELAKFGARTVALAAGVELLQTYARASEMGGEVTASALRDVCWF